MTSPSAYALLASLPAMPVDWRQEHLPVSEPRLEERLGLLPPASAELAITLGRLARDEAQGDDLAWLAALDDLTQRLAPGLGRQLALLIVDHRLLVAGVRRQNRGQEPPPAAGTWGRWLAMHWQEPGFGLGLRFPWLLELTALLQAGATGAAQELACQVLWQELDRLRPAHPFHLEAVLLYVVRWQVVAAWAGRDTAAGGERLAELVEATLGEYVHLFP
ncbi:MAG: hypothetical protein AB1634_00580 [Thermodesulfobacteriota bacterium]